jgi:hypothetical protein
MPRDSDNNRSGGKGRDESSKKSWREIDQGKDRSSHRQDSQRGAGGAQADRLQQQNSHEYRAYKSQLNKLFSGTGLSTSSPNALPDSIKAKLTDSESGQLALARKQAAKAIIDAANAAEISRALDAYRTEHGFPEEAEVLAKLLDVSAEEIVLQALQTLTTLQADNRLKPSASLKMRLKSVQVSHDDPDIIKIAKELAAKL